MATGEFVGTLAGKAPRGYSLGRPYGACIWIVIHTTEGAENSTAAENGNAYDATRTDSVSTHVFVDSNSVVQEVSSANRAWAALAVANNRGYQVELCAKAKTTVAGWHDAYHTSMLLLAEQHCARVAMKLGIPAKWCTKADVDARRPGFITHKNVTDWLDGTHTDPGPNFPFTEFINGVAHWKQAYAIKRLTDDEMDFVPQEDEGIENEHA